MPKARFSKSRNLLVEAEHFAMLIGALKPEYHRLWPRVTVFDRRLFEICFLGLGVVVSMGRVNA